MLQSEENSMVTLTGAFAAVPRTTKGFGGFGPVNVKICGVSLLSVVFAGPPSDPKAMLSRLCPAVTLTKS
jgi:hypothetical protein